MQTETKSYYRKSAHRVRELYKGRIIKNGRMEILFILKLLYNENK